MQTGGKNNITACFFEFKTKSGFFWQYSVFFPIPVLTFSLVKIVGFICTELEFLDFLRNCLSFLPFKNFTLFLHGCATRRSAATEGDLPRRTECFRFFYCGWFGAVLNSRGSWISPPKRVFGGEGANLSGLVGVGAMVRNGLGAGSLRMVEDWIGDGVPGPFGLGFRVLPPIPIVVLMLSRFPSFFCPLAFARPRPPAGADHDVGLLLAEGLWKVCCRQPNGGGLGFEGWGIVWSMVMRGFPLPMPQQPHQNSVFFCLKFCVFQIES